MRKLTFLFFFFTILTVLNGANYLSPINRIIEIEKVDTKIKYHFDSFAIIGSIKIFSNSKELESDRDYKIDYEKNVITFPKDYENVKISYMVLPKKLREKFSNYIVSEVSDSLFNKIKIKRKRYSSTANLNVSGSKTISFTVSNTSDVIFDQTLFLKVNGQLYKNMYIESQLSDNQLPITPEGNSKELSNIDKIFIRVYGNQYEFKFGDLDMNFDNTEFFNYHPFFEGIKAKWFSKNRYELAAAISKGKKGESFFYADESKQGPYYLSSNTDTGIKIVPGSEEIYLNGKIMQRGEDYTIDYSEGSITFTDKHFLSSSSYITAYYLYSDEYYKQNLYLSKNDIQIGNHITVGNYFIWEKDDKSNPLQQNFSEEDLEILRNSGDTIAWGSGVSVVDAGKGDYKLSENGDYYIYAPNDSLAIYDIRFTFVGSKNGDYILSDDGEYYVYAGEKQGEYIPEIKLVPPQNNLNYDIKTSISSGFFQFEGESIFTNHDKNSFSDIGDKDNFSNAIYLSSSIKPDLDKFKPILGISFLKKMKNLYTFAGLNKNTENLQYTILPDTLETLEKNLNFSLYPFNFISLKGDYSSKKLKNFAWVKEFNAEFRKKESKFLPFFSIITKNQKQQIFVENESDKNYTRYNLESYKKIKNIKIGLSGHSELFALVGNDKNLSGFRETASTSYLNYIYKSIAVKFLYSIAHKDSLRGKVKSISDLKQTFGLESKLNSNDNFLNAKIYHRIISYPEKRNFDLVTLNMRNSIFKNGLVINSNYKIDNLEFFPKIKELVKVGYGLYDSTGVIGGEGGYDWIVKYIDYEHPQKSTEVNLSASVTINPQTIIKQFPMNTQIESYIQLYENSTSNQKRKIYLFYPSIFFNPQTSVLSKKIVRHTLWTELIKNKLRFRWEYKINDIFDQRYQNSDLNKSGTMSEELTFKYSLPLSFKFNFTNEKRTESIYQSLFVNKDFNAGIFFRPNSALILSSLVGYATESAESIVSNGNYFIKNLYSEHNITIFYHRKYRIISKFKIGKIFKNSSYLDSINRRRAGLHLNTDININYKLNKYTSATLKYSGKIHQKAKDEHKLSLEIKAVF